MNYQILQSYISLPKNVSVFFGELVISKRNSRDKLLIFSGPLGEVKLNLKKVDPFGLGKLKISEDKQKIIINHKSKKDLKPLKTLIQGKIYGVTIGYLLSLRIVGVGYRVFLQEDIKNSKKNLIFKMGYSHDIKYQLPKSVRGFVLEPTLLCIYGIDKNQVAEIANKIRNIRPPENYKGKGIRFVNEKITLLQGKRK